MKKVLFFIAFSAIFTANAFADTNIISGIMIDGLKNVKPKSLNSVISSKKGKEYSSSTVRDDIRAILELGCFDNAEVNFDRNNGILTFSVTEKPYIEKINFKGNKQFSAGKLRSESVLKEKDHYDLLKFEETKTKITTLYRDSGYADVNIEVYPTVDSETNKMTISFLITENNKIVIGGVKIEGVISFKEKRYSNK